MDALIGLASGGALAAIKNAMEHGGEALKDAIEAAGKHVRKCTNCFVAGTLVATACGLVPIEEVQASDWVWARDEVTGEVRLCEVEETYRNESPVILEVTVGGETLATTPGHPFWVLDHGWKDAGDLEVGDRLVNLRGESVVVEDIRRRPVPEAVYNFSVAGLHTYFVGPGGIWVHNNSGAGCGVPGVSRKAADAATSGAPFVPDEYWTRIAPADMPSGPKRIDHIKYNEHTKQLEESRVVYDDYGRQQYRVDKTDHGRPFGNGHPNDLGHTDPHLHESTYAPEGTQFHNQETGRREWKFNLK